MKKILCLLLLICFCGCASEKVIDGKNYETYGLINQDDVKDSTVKYQPVWGNIIWGCILGETLIAPIYFFGFSMFEPISKKKETNE